MNEKLECTQCDKKWQRVKSRGRKPVVCPACADYNKQQETETKPKSNRTTAALSSTESHVYRFLPVSYWMCTNCEQTISVHVGIDHVPIHPCRLKRNQMLAFVQTTRQKGKRVTT